MADSGIDVLFLCTGNSARSILAEALLDHRGAPRFRAHSAGSAPKGAVHPLALEVLRAHGHATAHLRSKSWNEFASEGAPALDLVVTVCDNAAGETCPIWPGHPLTTHWGMDDPAAVEGPEAERLAAFRQTYAVLAERIERLVALRFDSLERGPLQGPLDEIGRT